MISTFLEYYLQILYKLTEFHNGFLVVIFLFNSCSQLTFKLKSKKLKLTWLELDHNQTSKYNCRGPPALKPLRANPTNWSNTFKQAGKLPTNCLSVFDHFVKLALRGLKERIRLVIKLFSTLLLKKLNSKIF